MTGNWSSSLSARSLADGDALPPLSFFDIATHTPVIVLNGMVFYLVESDFAADPEAACFRVEQLRFKLVPSQSLAEMEQYYIRAAAAHALEGIKTRYLTEVIDQRIESMEAMQRQMAQNDVLTFLVKCLIPKFQQLELSGTKAAVLPSIVPTSRRKPMTPTTQPLLTANNILETVIGRQALILDEKIYPLQPVTAAPEQDLLVFANGRTYAPAIPAQPLTKAQSAFYNKVIQSLKAQALAESPDRLQLLAELEAEFAALSGHIQIKDGYLYRGQTYGILQQGHQWVVYSEVPEYVVEAANGQLYRFDATRVGIIIANCQPKQLLFSGCAHVLAPYQHMFVSSGKAKNSICMSKGSAYYTRLHQMLLEEAICLCLHDAKYTLMAGYHGGNGNTPYYPIETFAYRRLTRSEAMRQRLPIFTYYR